MIQKNYKLEFLYKLKQDKGVNMNKGEIILYKTQDGKVETQLCIFDSTVWLIQAEIADIFAKRRSTVAEHISNILNEEELQKNSVCRNFRQTADDGKVYQVAHYNLDMILA